MCFANYASILAAYSLKSLSIRATIIYYIYRTQILLMKYLPTILLYTLVPFTLTAQSSIRQFSASKSLNYGYIARTGANKFGYAAQITSKENISSIMIAQLDRLLRPEWVNVYTDSVNTPGTDLRQQITACRNGGFAAAFTPESRNGSVFVFKIDSTGNLLWSRQYHLSSASQGTLLMEKPDGSIIVAGNRRVGFVVSAYLLSLDGRNGQVQWFKALTINGVSTTTGALAPARDSGFVIAGTGSGNISFVSRYNNEGDMLWTRTYKATVQGSFYYQDIKAITQTKDGGFAYTGIVPSSNRSDGYNMSIVKLTGNGSLQWAKETGTTGEDAGFSIQQNSDSSYTVTGSFTSANTWLVKLNKAGTASIFQRVLNAGYLSFPTTIQDNTGRYIMSGTAYTGVMIQPHGFIATFENDGTSCSGYLADRPIIPLSITNARYAILETDITQEATSDTAYFKKTSPPIFSKEYCEGASVSPGNITATKMQATASLNAALISNPVKTTIQLKLSGGQLSSHWMITVNDINGKLLHQQQAEGAGINRQIDVSRWAPGMYIINVLNGTWRQTLKVMVVK